MAKSYMKLDGNLVPISLDAKVTTSKEEQTKTVAEPNFSSGNVVVTPDTGKVLTQVTVVKDNDLVPANIVKDVNIFGVVGTAETGGGGGGFTVDIYSDHGASYDLQFADGTGNSYNLGGGSFHYTNVVWLIVHDVGMVNDYEGITESQALSGHFLTEDVYMSFISD